jgi:hypothetical protein
MGKEKSIKENISWQIKELMEYMGGPYKDLALANNPEKCKGIIMRLEKITSTNYEDEKVEQALMMLMEKMKGTIEQMLRGEQSLKENAQRAHEVISQLKMDIKMLKEARTLTNASVEISKRLSQLKYLIDQSINVDATMEKLSGEIDRIAQDIRKTA